MKTYWEVETYSKKLITKREDQDTGRHQEVVYAKSASNEHCYLETPDVSSEPDRAEDFMQVDGDPNAGDPAAGASALSLSYDQASHEADAISSIRATRDKKLAAADWTQYADTVSSGTLTQTQQDNWAIYRQELRDVPENTADSRVFDFDNDWPTQPQA